MVYITTTKFITTEWKAMVIELKLILVIIMIIMLIMVINFFYILKYIILKLSRYNVNTFFLSFSRPSLPYGFVTANIESGINHSKNIGLETIHISMDIPTNRFMLDLINAFRNNQITEDHLREGIVQFFQVFDLANFTGLYAIREITRFLTTQDLIVIAIPMTGTAALIGLGFASLLLRADIREYVAPGVLAYLSSQTFGSTEVYIAALNNIEFQIDMLVDFVMSHQEYLYTGSTPRPNPLANLCVHGRHLEQLSSFPLLLEGNFTEEQIREHFQPDSLPVTQTETQAVAESSTQGAAQSSVQTVAESSTQGAARSWRETVLRTESPNSTQGQNSTPISTDIGEVVSGVLIHWEFLNALAIMMERLDTSIIIYDSARQSATVYISRLFTRFRALRVRYAALRARIVHYRQILLRRQRRRR